MTDTITFPATFPATGFMGFATELEFMLDFTASMRQSGLKRFPTTYAELVAKQTRPMAEPKNFVPEITFPKEGGDEIVINGSVRSASAPKSGNTGGYEGPKDLHYTNDHDKKFGKAPGTRSGRGFVHAMSDAQKRFVLSLLETKDTTELATRMVRGWTLDPAEVDTISKQHARPFIDALLACPNKSISAIKGNDSGRIEDQVNGSAKQIEWLFHGYANTSRPALLTDKGILSESDIRAFVIKHNYSAKQMIDALLSMPKSRPIMSIKEMTSKTEEITEGMYVKDGRIFKVYFNQANTCLLVKELIDERFEYVGSAQYKLPRDAKRMTLDEAKTYGKLTGTCCMCSRKLTDESSIEAGIGPICAGKF